MSSRKMRQIVIEFSKEKPISRERERDTEKHGKTDDISKQKN